MKRTLVSWTLMLCTLVGPAALQAGDAPAAPAELSMAPADAIVFVHLRLADMWKSDLLKEWRSTLLKAGDDALAAIDKRFIPAPSTIDRLTVALSRGKEGQGEPNLIVAMTFTKAFNQDDFLERMAPGAEKKQAGGKTYYEAGKEHIGLYFLNDRTLVFGPVEAVHKALEKAPARTGNLAPAIKAASEGKPVVIAVNVSAALEMTRLPAAQQLPPQLLPLLEAKLAMITLDLEKTGRLELRLGYANSRDAGAAEDAIDGGLKMVRMMLAKGREEMKKKVLGDGKPGTLEQLPEAVGSLFGLGMMNRIDELLAAPPIKREGNSLKATIDLPQGGSSLVAASAVGIGLLVPAVQKVREAASRAQDANNLKQMALAMHNYASAYRGFPAAAICDPNGKPLLSWRVAILPYIEQDNLYKQFKLDEPWDSEHNKKLIPMMPQIYAIPGAPGKPGETHYRVFVGGGALFDLDKKVTFAQIADGTSNTLMIVEAAGSVTWTKPEELTYDAKKPLPKFYAGHSGGGFQAALADGSVRTISPNVMEATLRAAITRAGGEILGADW